MAVASLVFAAILVAFLTEIVLKVPVLRAIERFNSRGRLSKRSRDRIKGEK